MRYEHKTLIVAGALYIGGLIGHGLPALRPYVAPLAPLLLLVLGCAVLLPAARAGGGRFLCWAALVGLGCFAAEVAGVATGKVFGAYSYGTMLGPRIAAVPPIIGFNWVIVIAGAIGAARACGLRNAPAVFAAAALATGFDALIEPAAIALGYWTWHSAQIPLQNYIAWFALSGLAAGAYEYCVAARASASGACASASGAGASAASALKLSNATGQDANKGAAEERRKADLRMRQSLVFLAQYCGLQLLFFLGIRLALT